MDRKKAVSPETKVIHREIHVTRQHPQEVYYRTHTSTEQSLSTDSAEDMDDSISYTSTTSSVVTIESVSVEKTTEEVLIDVIEITPPVNVDNHLQSFETDELAAQLRESCQCGNILNGKLVSSQSECVVEQAEADQQNSEDLNGIQNIAKKLEGNITDLQYSDYCEGKTEEPADMAISKEITTSARSEVKEVTVTANLHAGKKGENIQGIFRSRRIGPSVLKQVRFKRQDDERQLLEVVPAKDDNVAFSNKTEKQHNHESLRNSYTKCKADLTEKISHIEACAQQTPTLDGAVARDLLTKLVSNLPLQNQLRSLAEQLEPITHESLISDIQQDVEVLELRLVTLRRGLSEMARNHLSNLEKARETEQWIEETEKKIFKTSEAIDQGRRVNYSIVENLYDQLQEHFYYPSADEGFAETVGSSDQLLLQQTEERLLIVQSKLRALEDQFEKLRERQILQREKFEKLKDWLFESMIKGQRCLRIAEETVEINEAKKSLFDIEALEAELPGQEAVFHCLQMDCKKSAPDSRLEGEFEVYEQELSKLEQNVAKYELEIRKIVAHWSIVSPSHLENIHVFVTAAYEGVQELERCKESDIQKCHKELDELSSKAESFQKLLSTADLKRKAVIVKDKVVDNQVGTKRKVDGLIPCIQNAKFILEKKTKLFEKMDIFSNWCKETSQNVKLFSFEYFDAFLNENSQIRTQIPQKKISSQKISDTLFELQSKFTVGEKFRVTENWMNIQVEFDCICDAARKRQLFFGELGEFLQKLEKSEAIAQEIGLEMLQSAEVTEVDYETHQVRLDKKETGVSRIAYTIPLILTLYESTDFDNAIEIVQNGLENKIARLLLTLEKTQKCLDGKRSVFEVIKEAQLKLDDMDVWLEGAMDKIAQSQLKDDVIDDGLSEKVKIESDEKLHFCNTMLKRLRKEKTDECYLPRERLAMLKTQILLLRSLIK